MLNSFESSTILCFVVHEVNPISNHRSIFTKFGALFVVSSSNIFSGVLLVSPIKITVIPMMTSNSRRIICVSKTLVIQMFPENRQVITENSTGRLKAQWKFSLATVKDELLLNLTIFLNIFAL